MKVAHATAMAVLVTSLIIHSTNVINEGAFEQSDGDEALYNFITISLGYNCQPAEFMRVHKIRFFAAPFDWCITPYTSLYNVINNSFSNFFKKDNLVPYAWNTEILNGILDTGTGIFYNHDFPERSFDSINKHYKVQYAKYKRRIDRLFKQMGSGKHVYFIRYLEMNKAEACELYALLKRTFPHTQFTLIVIGNNAVEFEQDWGLPHIKSFFMYCEQKEGMSLEENPFWRELCNKIRSGALL
jgi:hypothetical protein